MSGPVRGTSGCGAASRNSAVTEKKISFPHVQPTVNIQLGTHPSHALRRENSTYDAMHVCESCGDIGLNETRGGRDIWERHGRLHGDFDEICLPRTRYGSGGLQAKCCETFPEVRTFVSG